MSTRDVAVVHLECGKANAMDENFLQVLSNALDQALLDGYRAVVLTGYERFFSAGLNLRSLPETADGMADFIDRFEDVMGKLLAFPRPVVAAVNGHALAGGVIMACACDVRVGAEGNFKIGLTEVDVGVPFPATALEIVRRVIAPSRAPSIIVGAEILDPKGALEAGLLDRVVPPERLLEDATAWAEQLGGKPSEAYRLAKQALIAPTVERIAAHRVELRERWVQCWISDEARACREAVLGA